MSITDYRVTPNYSERGSPVSQMITVQLRGEIVATGQADIRTRINEIIAAFSNDAQDFIFYHDDGSESPHVLRNAGSLTGVRILSRSWDKDEPEEYATMRSYTVTLAAEYPAVGTSQLLSWQESVITTGTADSFFVWRPVLINRPFRGGKVLSYQVADAGSTFASVQQIGEAVGYQGWPALAVPPPLWPNLEHRDLRVITYSSPRLQGAQFVGYRISWFYQFSLVPTSPNFPNIR